jgi:hypothetical protein
MPLVRWDLEVLDRYVGRRREKLTSPDALGGIVSWLTAAKRTCQSSAATRILDNLLTPLGFRLSELCPLGLQATMVTAAKRR